MGPVACGMPEVLIATAALAVPELDGKIAFISDARVSGVSHGAIGVHCSPEAIVGGPIGCVEDGDLIRFDLLNGTISVNISDADMSARRARLSPRKPPPQVRRGYLADWSATVAQASSRLRQQSDASGVQLIKKRTQTFVSHARCILESTGRRK
jgi:dihydroxy-acid dehydratase